MTKPIAQLTGQDGNVFAVMARAGQALKTAGQVAEYREMLNRVTTEAHSYEQALSIITEYVEDHGSYLGDDLECPECGAVHEPQYRRCLECGSDL